MRKVLEIWGGSLGPRFQLIWIPQFHFVRETLTKGIESRIEREQRDPV